MTSTVPLSPPEDAHEPLPVHQDPGGLSPGDEIPGDPGEIGAREQLRWFSTLWVMAAAVHFTDSDPLSMLPVLALGLPVLLFPTSALAFGLFVAVAAVTGAMSLPTAANHKVLSLLVALAFATAALWVWATRNRPDTRGTFLARWLEAARRPAGLTLLVVYLFTVFDKVNTAFFDPATSCAGSLLDQLLDYNGILVEAGPDIVRVSSIGTVLVEATILVCLAVPRLRRWGLLLGVGFHLVLAPASFWDFATMVFALYILFVPTRVFAGLAPRSAGIRRLALAAFGLHMLLAITVNLAGTMVSPFGLRWHTLLVLTWYIAVIPMMVQLLRACLADRGPWAGWRVSPVLLLVPLLAFANGSAPYLGLKTEGSYSMFSNLHTEPGAANHLLPGLAGPQLFPYQRDTVTITKIDIRRGPDSGPVSLTGWTQEKPPTTVPWLELRRMVGNWRAAGVADIHLEYVRGGVPRSVDNAVTDPELGTPLPWWQQHLMAFRAISSGDGPDVCRW
jgi:hypothetical protein